MKIAGIYKIQRIGSDQCYVGSSYWMKKRWNVHRRQLNRGEHHARHLQNAWTKHGASAFEFVVLEVCDGLGEELKKMLHHREQHWIDALDPRFNTCQAAGSTLGFKMPREIVERHRQQIAGRKLSPEHAAIARTLALGLKRSPETKEKLRQAGLRRGMPAKAIENSVKVRKGKKLTQEHIDKVLAARSDYKHSPEVIQRMVASNTPEVRERKGAASRGKQQSPEHKEKKRQALIAYHQRNRLERDRAAP